MNANDWRYFNYRPGAAHLWTDTPSRMLRSRCGKLLVRDAVALHSLSAADALPRPKCKRCIPHEVRRG